MADANRGSDTRCPFVTLSLLLCALTVALSVPAAQQTRTETVGATASHLRMLDALRRIADETPDRHPYLGDARARRARRLLDGLPASTEPPDRWELLTQLGQAELRLGDEATAIKLFTEAHEVVAAADAQVDLTPWITSSLFNLGVAYLRLGETENCSLHPTASSCILPLRGDSIHRQQDPARMAIGVLTDVLELDSTHRAAQWLLNIAYMTVGGYPEEVPGAHTIPPRTFESDVEMPPFNNIAPVLGLDTFDLSGGAIADDFDNDGYLDIVTSTWDTDGQIRLFHNNQDGTFSERTEAAGLVGLLGGLNLLQADYDNDGNVDIYVLRGAWLSDDGRHPNSLLRNRGDGTFLDVTFDAGLGEAHYPSQTASWADYDNDGDLDLYVGNESTFALEAPSQLFRNNGDGTFADVAADAGVENFSYAKGVIWGDYDGDRWMDLYVSNLSGSNRLYRNNGDGTFTDRAAYLGVGGPADSFPVWFWDVNNDGSLDLFVSAYEAGIDDLMTSALDLPVDVDIARLYLGTGSGRFREAGEEYGIDRPTAPMGANFGDLDNDGHLDFYLGTGYPDLHNIMPNLMYRSRNGASFEDVTYTGGFGHIQKGHAVVFADLDHDGDQDIFEQMGGAYPIDGFTNVLYENPGFGNHWITVTLVGARSNRSAIGARLRLEIVDDGVRRSIFRHVNSGGSFGANPLRQTIGLGQAPRIETLDVFWPMTGETQTFQSLSVDQVIEIVEDEAAYTTVPVESFRLGGG